MMPMATECELKKRGFDANAAWRRALIIGVMLFSALTLIDYLRHL
jgi:hypothetical protein